MNPLADAHSRLVDIFDFIDRKIRIIFQFLLNLIFHLLRYIIQIKSLQSSQKISI